MFTGVVDDVPDGKRQHPRVGANQEKIAYFRPDAMIWISLCQTSDLFCEHLFEVHSVGPERSLSRFNLAEADQIFEDAIDFFGVIESLVQLLALKMLRSTSEAIGPKFEKTNHGSEGRPDLVAHGIEEVLLVLSRLACNFRLLFHVREPNPIKPHSK
jgi:hypothetical protein